MPHVVLVVALVDVACNSFADSLAFTRTLEELSFKTVAILPDILPVTMRFAILELSGVLVSVYEFLLALSMLQKLSEITAIGRIVLVNEVTLPVLLVLLPFALVVISLRRFPDSKSVLFAVSPLSLETLSVVPCEFALTVALSIFKLADV